MNIISNKNEDDRERDRTDHHAHPQRGFSIIELMLVALITISVTAMAIPTLNSGLRNYRSLGDARSMASAISLAKMRAAADFTQSRVYVDLIAKTFAVQTYSKSGSTWTNDGETVTLATGDSFGFGSISSAPSGTQTTLGQAAACRNDANTSDIANTACIIFNSRGIPIDSIGAPTGEDALYLTDGSSVYGATLTAAGLVRLWRADVTTGTWKQR